MCMCLCVCAWEEKRRFRGAGGDKELMGCYSSWSLEPSQEHGRYSESVIPTHGWTDVCIEAERVHVFSLVWSNLIIMRVTLKNNRENGPTEVALCCRPPSAACRYFLSPHCQSWDLAREQSVHSWASARRRTWTTPIVIHSVRSMLETNYGCVGQNLTVKVFSMLI